MENLKTTTRALLLLTVTVWATFWGGTGSTQADSPAPLEARGLVFRIENGSLVTTDAASRRVLWRYGSDLQAEPYWYTSRNGALAHWNLRVYVFSRSRRLVALDAKEGRVLWSRPLAFDKAELTAAGNRLFVINTGNASYEVAGLALDPSTGRELWRRRREGRGEWIEEIVGNVVIWGYMEDGAVTTSLATAHDLRTGATLWRVAGTRAGHVGDYLFYKQQMFWIRGRVSVTRINTRTGASVDFDFDVEPRPSCGELDQMGSANGGVFVDETYIYAYKQDGCGTFIARYRQDGGPKQTPTILTEPPPRRR